MKSKTVDPTTPKALPEIVVFLWDRYYGGNRHRRVIESYTFNSKGVENSYQKDYLRAIAQGMRIRQQLFEPFARWTRV